MRSRRDHAVGDRRAGQQRGARDHHAVVGMQADHGRRGHGVAPDTRWPALESDRACAAPISADAAVRPVASPTLRRDVARRLAGRRHRLARRPRHQAAVVGDGDEAEAHADHPRGIGGGAVVDAGELAVLLARRQQLLVDAEDQRLLAVEDRDQAEREAHVGRADIDAADARHVEDLVDVVDRLPGSRSSGSPAPRRWRSSGSCSPRRTSRRGSGRCCACRSADTGRRRPAPAPRPCCSPSGR